MTAPRRRWSFGLRTLLIGVTVLGCWLGWQAHIATSRIAALQAVENRGGNGFPESMTTGRQIPLLVRLRCRFFHDVSPRRIHLPIDEFTAIDEQEIQALFPEVSVDRGYGRWVK